VGCPDKHRLARAVVTSLAEHFDQHKFEISIRKIALYSLGLDSSREGSSIALMEGIKHVYSCAPGL
jgi:hypothetical protein